MVVSARHRFKKLTTDHHYIREIETGHCPVFLFTDMDAKRTAGQSDRPAVSNTISKGPLRDTEGIGSREVHQFVHLVIDHIV
jgi:hypothetical protein